MHETCKLTATNTETGRIFEIIYDKFKAMLIYISINDTHKLITTLWFLTASLFEDLTLFM
jgi:hypothetical protein